MKCERVREEIKAYIDGELRPWTRWIITRHIATCDDCRREMQEMAELTNGVRNAGSTPAPQGLKDRVLGSLTFEPKGGGARRPFWRTAGGIAATSAAVVVLAAVVLPTFQSAKGPSPQGQSARRIGIVKDFDLDERETSAPGSAMLPPTRPMPASAPLSKHKMAEPADDVEINTFGVAKARQSVPASASAPQMIIKSADLGVRVRSFQQASDAAVSIAKSAGGYVTDTSASSDQGVPTEGCMTLRVPVDAFERTMNRLTKLGTVTGRSISGEDVTGESVDLESRLRNLRAEERQYLEIMNRAKRIPDVVTVTGELTRVRGDIEEAQGRLKYLKTSAAMSTINLSLSEKKRALPHKSSIESSFGNAIGSLVGTLSGLASLIIWLAVYSPFWALPLLIWLYTRKRAAVSA